MSEKHSHESNAADAAKETVGRRLFLQTTGKWSGAAIAAVVAGGWLASAPKAEAGAWINRRVGGGVGGWVNRAVGGGSWINGAGAGGWINRRVGGGAWVNRF
ncbi:MAG: hypothetical protein K8R87_05030 [Verrucomicrobia bacterium]|nr:hypothetical protein [Verrucomicrobiota bacterium]